MSNDGSQGDRKQGNTHQFTVASQYRQRAARGPAFSTAVARLGCVWSRELRSGAGAFAYAARSACLAVPPGFPVLDRGRQILGLGENR